MKGDYNYIAKLEAAIKEKYGPEAIQNPKNSWNKEKEKKYLKELKKSYHDRNQKPEKRKRRIGSVLISEKALEKASTRSCPVCEKYSFDRGDDLYMNKFRCCYKCYIQYVDGREKRWHSGWRPDKNTMVIMK